MSYSKLDLDSYTQDKLLFELECQINYNNLDIKNYIIEILKKLTEKPIYLGSTSPPRRYSKEKITYENLYGSKRHTEKKSDVSTKSKSTKSKSTEGYPDVKYTLTDSDINESRSDTTAQGAEEGINDGYINKKSSYFRKNRDPDEAKNMTLSENSGSEAMHSDISSTVYENERDNIYRAGNMIPR